MSEHAQSGRLIENVLALGGFALAAVYVLVAEVGLVEARCIHPEGFPWGVFSVVAVCMAPKTLGRATAGRIWEAGMGRLTRRRRG